MPYPSKNTFEHVEPRRRRGTESEQEPAPTIKSARAYTKSHSAPDFRQHRPPLPPALEEILKTSTHADFCVGYFNLRGWNRLGQAVEDRFEGGEQSQCRLLVGMPTLPDDEIRQAYSLAKEGPIDAARALHLKRRMAEQFRAQLTIGALADQDEWNLQRLARQLRSGKVVVKLFLKNSLHAKLYLVHRNDVAAPVVGYVGSSNLTFAGLMKQFELNVDVVEGDAANKLAKWFEERWNDPWCLDITEELAKIIEASWARPTPILPYHIYLKIAYHLAQEARAGLSEFRIPKDFGDKLFQYQVEAVKIAAHHLNHDVRRGVLLGDVVGLGKTLMATALARIFEDDHGLETLILCPKNLVEMWEGYVHGYRLRAKVLSITRAIEELPEMLRYRIVILDESHNLRNREGKRFKAIQEYVGKNECRCILLSATPYNKAYLDLASQLRIFIDEKQDLGIRPDRYVREIGEIQFQARHQCPVRSLAAFEKTPHPDDWRDLMRLFMVRRTRSFIKDHYAILDPERNRRYLLMANGERSYFPDRIPRTVRFKFDETDRDDPYARLYNQAIVDRVNRLDLPRYGLGNYVANNPHEPPTLAEAEIIKDLSRAGRRLMGFCRTNLFKRLESGGLAFIQSLERLDKLRLPLEEHGLVDVLRRLEDAFSVEPLSKAFFTEISELFFEVADGLTNQIPDENERRLFVQTLFNRLIFLRFVEKKGWLSPPPPAAMVRAPEEEGAGGGGSGRSSNYLQALWQAGQDGVNPFWPTRLSALFTSLNHPKGDRVREVSRPLIGEVPYLNGGLFEDNPRFADPKLTIPPEVFKKLVGPGGLFYRYNFTVEESSPFDVQVAVDPEILGKIFEQLTLSAKRHDTGSYYTPREIVQFMCREALVGYLSSPPLAEDDCA